MNCWSHRSFLVIPDYSKLVMIGKKLTFNEIESIIIPTRNDLLATYRINTSHTFVSDRIANWNIYVSKALSELYTMILLHH